MPSHLLWDFLQNEVPIHNSPLTCCEISLQNEDPIHYTPLTCSLADVGASVEAAESVVDAVRVGLAHRPAVGRLAPALVHRGDVADGGAGGGGGGGPALALTLDDKTLGHGQVDGRRRAAGAAHVKLTRGRVHARL